ncbi:MAG: hypothetical protein A3D41_04080 [Candidatus Sungbacteria bacterium RIFCSPHIGHO2_02_FULL_41_12b]|nr:MAG: hypothetical protein A3D41_04080 [Candidatus Sungbacteria bacterium RIFCSPHIGHO2_02_FULL_41_12b]
MKSDFSRILADEIINMEQFWHNIITDKSFVFLQKLRKKFKFVLIGGWAVYFYTHSLKSKDIDIIVNFEELGRLRESFDVRKNDRLKKYEIQQAGFDIDIYVPHWSELGLPLEDVLNTATLIEGFRVPEKEVLFALKLFAYSQRKSSLKGKKDMIDILSLLYSGGARFPSLFKIIEKYNARGIGAELKEILTTVFEVKELNLNRKHFSDFKKPILKELQSRNF